MLVMSLRRDEGVDHGSGHLRANRAGNFSVAWRHDRAPSLWRRGVSGWQARIGAPAWQSTADLPFPIRVRDELISCGLAQPHHVLPHSGWVSCYIHDGEDADRVIELFRLNYERPWLGNPDGVAGAATPRKTQDAHPQG